MQVLDPRHEERCRSLNDPEAFRACMAEETAHRIALLPRVCGRLLIGAGNLLYGRKPSYGKFKALEVIARIPYQSWELATYFLLTLGYGDERRAIRLAHTSFFSRVAQDNETMHVVVLSQLAKRHHGNRFVLHTFIPFLFSFAYFSAGFLLYLARPRWSFELNYLFEDHALRQYMAFLEREGERLRQEPLHMDFLAFYGRQAADEYELFLSIRNDELLHRNESWRHAEQAR